MASTSETGHAKNVANFQDLIEFVTAYGATYNPSKNSLKLLQLSALKATAEASLTALITQNTNYNNKVNERAIAFSGLKPFATRLFNVLKTTDASDETIANAKTFNNKLQGRMTCPELGLHKKCKNERKKQSDFRTMAQQQAVFFRS